MGRTVKCCAQGAQCSFVTVIRGIHECIMALTVGFESRTFCVVDLIHQLCGREVETVKYSVGSNAVSFPCLVHGWHAIGLADSFVRLFFGLPAVTEPVAHPLLTSGCGDLA